MDTASGHRFQPHTADIRIQAWAPSPEQCVTEAVTAMVESFVHVPPGVPTQPAELEVPTGPADQMLVAALDEVIYTMDTSGRIPASAQTTATDHGMRIRLDLAEPDRLELIGPVPKGVTLHALEFSRTERGWSCQVVLDV